MISVNSVYETVQAALNKDHRGLLRPEEFNNLAKLSLYNVIDSVYDRLDATRSMVVNGRLDKFSMQELEEVRNNFHTRGTMAYQVGGIYDKPADFDHLDSMYYGDAEITEASVSDTRLAKNISYMGPNNLNPVYIEFGDTYEVISEDLTDDIEIFYYRVPKDPRWTYLEVSGNLIYDGTNPDKQDFELPEHLFHEIVLDILFYCGMNIRDAEVLQTLLNDRAADLNEDRYGG